MSKVHPKALLPSSHQETFTVWTKSLVLNGNGCTVFDSSGHIVFRVDNYDSTCRDKVYLMDLRGRVLFTIVKKKFCLLDCWEGFRSFGEKTDMENSEFEVRKTFRNFLRGKSLFEIIVRRGKSTIIHARMESLIEHSACKISDIFGNLIAQVREKRSTEGFALGKDVLTMMVEPNQDHSLVMGLVVVHCLISHKM